MIIDMIFRFFSYTRVYLKTHDVTGSPFFSALPEKKGEKRGAGVRFSACCGCSSGKHLFDSRYEHTDSPYGRYGTRRLLRYNGFANNCV